MRAAILLWMGFGIVGMGVGEPKAKPDKGAEPDPAVAEKIEKLGGKVMRIAQNEKGLEVHFHLGRNQDGLRLFEPLKPGTPKPPALDGELRVLKKLKNLVWPHLGGTDVTDQGLTHLADLTSLTRLHLEKTKVTDAGLAHLKKLKNLTYLNLYQTNVTDAGLRHLHGLEKLENLDLWQTKVTPAGGKKLQQALPNCQIDLGWDVEQESSQPDS